jgi:hypothetical protein
VGDMTSAVYDETIELSRPQTLAGCGPVRCTVNCSTDMTNVCRGVAQPG